jgi:hypothetical protein
MKKYLLLAGIILFFSTSSILAQEIKTSDTSSVAIDGASLDFIFSWKKHQPSSKPKAKDAHWAGLGFAFSGLKGLENVELNYGKSYTLMLNCAEYNIPLSHHWLLASGLGFDWSRYHFNGNKCLQDIDGIAQFVSDGQGRDFKDSKILLYYAKVPLLLEYQKKGRHTTFYVNGGIEALLKLYSKSQVEVRTNDKIQKIDLKGFNIFPVSARFLLQAGVNNVSLFGYYQPFPIFQKGKGPELNPFGAGIMFSH